MAEKELVLVTGGSGFIGLYCIMQLLQKGYRVRTTVRSLKRESEVRETLKKAEGTIDIDSVEFKAANLLSDDGWADAVAGCAYVLHVASPFPASVPKNEDELIVPAREGTLRVLRAARDAGVKRVVVTSSFAAIGYGHGDKTEPFTEKDWSDPKSPEVSAYAKSKTLAERAAWEFMEKEGGALELAVVNPVAVFGPVLSEDTSTSIQLVLRMMTGSLPGCPQIGFGVVDVRDVASLHIMAMTDPKAKGERFMAVSGDFMMLQQMGAVLRERMGNKARKVPTRTLPNFLLRIASWFDPAVKLILPELGKMKRASNEKARTVLGWDPISPEDSLVASAETLIKLGMVKV